MSHIKVLELAQKFAKKTVIYDDNEKFTQQRIRISQFFHEMRRRFISITGDMEGDLRALKEKGFPKNELHEFAKIYQTLVNLRNDLNPEKVYESFFKIISTVNNRTFKAHLTTLEVIIQHFLKNNEIDLGKNSLILQNTKINSLKLLTQFVKEIEDYLIRNPKLPIPSQFPEPEPKLLNIKEENIINHKSDDKTVSETPESKKLNFSPEGFDIY